MPAPTRCPSCSAALAPGASWCSLCHADLRPKLEPVRRNLDVVPGTVPTATPVAAIGLEEIKSLIALVGREPFQEFEFEAGDMRFRIRKDGPAPVNTVESGAPSTGKLSVDGET